MPAHSWLEKKKGSKIYLLTLYFITTQGSGIKQKATRHKNHRFCVIVLHFVNSLKQAMVYPVMGMNHQTSSLIRIPGSFSSLVIHWSSWLLLAFSSLDLLERCLTPQLLYLKFFFFYFIYSCYQIAINCQLFVKHCGMCCAHKTLQPLL